MRHKKKTTRELTEGTLCAIMGQMAKECFVYRFRLRPNRTHRVGLCRFAGARRWIWNWALAKKQAYYQETKHTLSTDTLEKELPLKKKQEETAWLGEIDSQLPQQALRDLDNAYRGFFEGTKGFPHFKSKKRDEPTFRI